MSGHRWLQSEPNGSLLVDLLKQPLSVKTAAVLVLHVDGLIESFTCPHWEIQVSSRNTLEPKSIVHRKVKVINQKAAHVCRRKRT